MAPDAHDPRISRHRKSGSVTLVALCLMTALGIALGSYLALCTRSAQFSARIVSSEQAMQLAQTGLEEALWALNQNTWTTSGPAGTTAWTTTGANRSVTLTYPLSVPNQSGRVVLTIANYASVGPGSSAWPTITSAATVTLQGGQTFTKTLFSTTGPAPLFGNAIASANSYVKFDEGGTVDSWNSDPSNNGSFTPYATPTAPPEANFNATIAGRTDGSSNGVILNQATINGYVATYGLPVSYSTSGSPSGKILGPTTATGVNIDTTRIGKSAFIPLSSVCSISAPTTFDKNYSGILGLVQFLLDLLAGLLFGNVRASGDVTIDDEITISQPTKLLIDGSLKITTGGSFLFPTRGKITITTSGSLELFVTGDVTIGADGFDNKSGNPRKLAIYCTSTSTTDPLTYETTNPSNFHGVIFCENKPIEIKQNGNFYGALLSGRYVRFTNNATSPVFHYDSALRNVRFSGVSTPYVIKTTTEL
jgi:hypothetical protein